MKQLRKNAIEENLICRGICQRLPGSTSVGRIAVMLAVLLITPTHLFSQVVLNNVTVGVTTTGSTNQWVSAALNPVTNKLYVANNGDNIVSVADLSTNAVTKVSVGTSPQSVAVSVALNKVYVANYGNGSVSVIDGATNAVTTFTLPTGAQPEAVIVNPVTNNVFVGELKSSSPNLYVLDGVTGSILKTIPIGTFLGALAVDPSLNQVYVVGGGVGFLIVDGTSGGSYLSTSVTLTGCTSPASVAANPVSHKVYVACSGSSNAAIVDGHAKTFLKTVTAGNTPVAVGVDPVTNRAFVANTGDNSFTLIDGATDTATQVTSATDPHSTVGVNSATGKVYFPYRFLPSGSGFVVLTESNNSLQQVSGASYTEAVAVNPITNRIYLANRGIPATVTIVDGTTYTPSSAIPTGASPSAVVEDPVNGIVYTIDSGGNSVTPINESTLAAASDIAVGSNPVAGVVDPFRQTLYVANAGDGINPSTVSVVANGSAASVAVGVKPSAIGIDLARNKVYVANYGSGGSGSVTVIDQLSRSVTNTVGVGGGPEGLAVNPTTNKIYVSDSGSNAVSVIDGATGSVTATVNAGSTPGPIAANVAANQVWVVNTGSNNVTQIDGATNTPTTIAVGTNPVAIAVNPITNQIYVANNGGNNVSVIDGATAAVVSTINVGTAPTAIWVSAAKNQIYVANSGSKTLTVIDGLSGKASTVSVGTTPSAVAANPATGTIFVANASDKTVIAVNPASPVKIPLTTQISGVADNQTVMSAAGFVTGNASPSFQVQINPAYTSTQPYSSLTNATNPTPSAVYYQLGSLSGAWKTATPGSNGQAAISLSNVPLGQQILYTYAAYGNEGVPSVTASQSNNYYSGNSPETGNIVPIVFNVLAQIATSTTLTSGDTQVQVGASVTLTATVSAASGMPAGTVTFANGGTAIGTATLNGSGVATYTGVLPGGSNTITASYGGQGVYSSSTSNSVTVVVKAGSTPSSTALMVTPSFSPAGQPITFKANVTGSSGTPTGIVTFSNGSAVLGSGTLTAGVATFTTSSLGSGSYAIVAAFPGDAIYAPSTSSPASLLLTNGPTATTTTLLATASAITSGQNVTFTAAVVPQKSVPAVPTGQVTFSSGSTVLGTATLNTQAQATFSTTSLAAGSNSVTAKYAGDVNFSGSTSGAAAVTVNGPSAIFTLTANPSSLTISSGGTGQTTITLSPVNGYKGVITLSCGNLPLAMTCSFAPSSITADGSNAAQTTVLTVNTYFSAALHPAVDSSRRVVETLAFLPAFCLLGLWPFKRKRSVSCLMAFLFLTIGGFVLTGCAAKSAKVLSGTYTVPVTAQGTTTQTLNLTIQVQ